MTAETCRSCGAPILWAKTEKGKHMPVDAAPDPEGNIELRGGVAHVLGPFEQELAARPLYVSHYATCPDADKWRKR